jgi:glutamyl-tRNA reductase
VALGALSLHARSASAAARAEFERGIAATAGPGCVLLATCHRVELYGASDALEAVVGGTMPAGVTIHRGEAAVTHLVRLAVGLDSAVVAEDQVLHQLRRAVQRARSTGSLPPALDRALDLALRAGRVARTWMPRRQGLAELALARVAQHADTALPVLVVGAGEMGRRLARALASRGSEIAVTSRTPERAALLAAEVAGRAVPFDPGASALTTFGGVAIALSGRWPLSEASRAVLAAQPGWVIDLSSPPALDASLVAALGERLLTIDDLAEARPGDLSPRLMAQLDRLVDDAVAEHTRWQRHDAERQLARALADRAQAAQHAELVALWRRVPDLDDAARAEVEQMARRLADRLLREPLEQLNADEDGRHAGAARSLFRL